MVGLHNVLERSQSKVNELIALSFLGLGMAGRDRATQPSIRSINVITIYSAPVLLFSAHADNSNLMLNFPSNVF